MKPIQWLQLLFIAFVWATSFTSIEIGLTEVNPTSVMFWRLVPAALLTVFTVFYFKLSYPRDPVFWGLCFIVGLSLTTVPFVLFAEAQVYIEAGLASILNACVPIFTAVFAHFSLRDERMTPIRVIGLILGITGITIIFGLDSLENFSLYNLGQLMVIGATLSYGIAFIVAKKYINPRKVDGNKAAHPLVIASSVLVCGAIVMFPIVLLLDGELQAPRTLGVWLPVMFMSIFGTGVAFMVYFNLLSQVETIKVAIVTFLMPPIAIVVAWIALDEVLTPNVYLGMLLIFLGIMCINGYVSAWLRKTSGKTG